MFSSKKICSRPFGKVETVFFKNIGFKLKKSVEICSQPHDEYWLTWEWSDTQVENDPHCHLLDEYMGE